MLKKIFQVSFFAAYLQIFSQQFSSLWVGAVLGSWCPCLMSSLLIQDFFVTSFNMFNYLPSSLAMFYLGFQYGCIFPHTYSQAKINLNMAHSWKVSQNIAIGSRQIGKLGPSKLGSEKMGPRA